MALAGLPAALFRLACLGTSAHGRRDRTPVTSASSKYIESKQLNFIVWLVVGGLIGWVASMVVRPSGRQGILLNVVVGIVGAMLGGWMLSGPFGRTAISHGSFSLHGLVVPLLVAIILLTFTRLARGSAAR